MGASPSRQRIVKLAQLPLSVQWARTRRELLRRGTALRALVVGHKPYDWFRFICGIARRAEPEHSREAPLHHHSLIRSRRPVTRS